MSNLETFRPRSGYVMGFSAFFAISALVYINIIDYGFSAALSSLLWGVFASALFYLIFIHPKVVFFDEEGNVLKSTAESPAGHFIEAAVLKTKVCKWDRKVGYMALNYTRGVDILQDTIDVATHFGFIQEPAQGSFTLVDPDSGVALEDAEGKPIKIRGKKNLRPYLEEHLDLWHRLYDKIYEKLTAKEDPYALAFAKMVESQIQSFSDINLNEEQEIL